MNDFFGKVRWTGKVHELGRRFMWTRLVDEFGGQVRRQS